MTAVLRLLDQELHLTLQLRGELRVIAQSESVFFYGGEVRLINSASS